MENNDSKHNFPACFPLEIENGGGLDKCSLDLNHEEEGRSGWTNHLCTWNVSIGQISE